VEKRILGHVVGQSAGIASQIPMKKSATQTRKQCLDLDPADYSVGAMDDSGNAGADHGHDLAATRMEALRGRDRRHLGRCAARPGAGQSRLTRAKSQKR